MAKGGRRGRRRSVLVAGTAAVVLVLGVGGWVVFFRSSDPAAASVQYRAAAVTTGTLQQTVSASGTVAATHTEDLTFPASGEVTAVWVKAGQKVSKGQRLAAIDSAALASAVAAAKATLATAQAELAADRASGATSTELSAASAAITAAQAQVTAATAGLAGATLTAPFAGTVTSVGYTVGQQVSAGSSGGSGSSTGSGSSGAPDAGTGAGAGQGAAQGSGSSTSTATTGIQVVSTGSYEVEASVDASDVSQVKAGNQVIITVGDARQNVFGTVASVGIVATNTSGVATFPVVVAVTGSPSGVYPGATATLQIVFKQLSDVMLVPTLAISRSGDTATVLVQQGDEQERRTIQTGTSSGGQTQVTSGLTEGEQVLVAVPTGPGGGTGQTGTGGGGFPGGGRGEFPGGGQGGFPGAGQGGFPGGVPPGGGNGP